jgi:cell fate (sporulation/competence/biofilm development) regulator YmcA (YheA/YmcA/DUF963 family)
MDHKKRVAELEKRISAGEAVIILDQIDGQLYLNDKKTTIAEIRESHKEAILIIDDIYDLLKKGEG